MSVPACRAVVTPGTYGFERLLTIMDTAGTSADDLLQRLVSAGVLVRTDETDEFTLSDSFRAARTVHLAALEDLSADASAREATAFTEGTPVDPNVVPLETLATVKALDDTLEFELENATLLTLSIGLGAEDHDLPTSGVPAAFTPIRGTTIATFVDLHAAAVIYCWREDCPPCDTVKADLEALLDSGRIPDTVGLGAVYGPDCPTLLQERYDVAGAPTTLFCVNGRVDSRYVGARTPTVFEAEIAEIVDQAAFE